MNFAKFAAIIAATVTLSGVASSASANEGALNAVSADAGQRTRAEVIAERNAAGVSHNASVEADYRWLDQAVSTRSRAEVVRERDAAEPRRNVSSYDLIVG